MKRRLVILLFLAFTFTRLYSQGIFTEAATSDLQKTEEDHQVLNGYSRGFMWSGARNVNFASLMGEVALKSRLTAGKTFLSGEIRVREGLMFDQRKTTFELKEAYAGYTGKSFDLFIGNQIVTWGRADGFNPTNNISPNDYFFLTPEADDQKLSNFMIRSGLKFSPATELEIIAIPVFKPSIYRYDLLDLGEGVTFGNLVLPETILKNGSLAVRFNAELPAVGFSLSWFRGYDPFYGFNLDTLSLYPSKTIGYRPALYRKNVLGADFALPVNTWIIRGEAAVNLPENPAGEMFIPFRDLAWTAALEHPFAGFTLLLEYIGKTVLSYTSLEVPVLTDPSNPAAQMAYASRMVQYESQLFNRKIFFQQERSNHALLLSLSRMMFHDLVNLELSGYYNLTSEEYFVRSMLKWNLSDALSAATGFSTMQGPDRSIFDEAGKILNGFFIGMTASF